MKRSFLPLLLSASILGGSIPWPRAAWAQAAPPAIGDEVKLKDGSIYRGTIVELVPNDHVVLLLPTGETRRFAMTDVAYQGRAPDAPLPPLPQPAAPSPPAAPPAPAPPPNDAPPAAPQPAVTVTANKVAVHVASDQDDVTLLFPTGQANIDAVGMGYDAWGGVGWVGVSGSAHEYANVCAAPCDAQLPTGEYHLALSRGGGRAVEASDPVRLSGPGTLRVHYESRQVARVTGWLLLAASAGVGLGLMVDGSQKNVQNIQSCQTGTCNANAGQGEVVAGAVVGLAGPLLSLIFILQRDKAHIELVPNDASHLLRLPGTSGESLAVAPVAPGPAIRVRF